MEDGQEAQEKAKAKAEEEAEEERACWLERELRFVVQLGSLWQRRQRHRLYVHFLELVNLVIHRRLSRKLVTLKLDLERLALLAQLVLWLVLFVPSPAWLDLEL